MKTMKKIATLLLALAMVLSLAAPVFADETYTITINNSAEGHTYEAYQIFTGKLNITTDENGKEVKVLSDVQWGSNAKQTGAVAKEILENLTTEEAISYVDLSTTPAGTSTAGEGKYVIAGLTPGYYLVKDKNGSLNGDNDSYTQYILKVVADVTATPKSDVPSVQKKVDDINDSNHTEDEVVWEDSADHDIGDSVSFQLKATLANNVSAYKTYKIIFHDTMSAGLTYTAITKVTVDGNEITSGYTVDTEVNADGTTTLTITFDDVKEQGAGDSSVVIVEYTATLNENAVLGNVGNPNYVYLEYSNNPNWGAEGDNDNDGIPDDEDDDDDNDGTPDDEDDDDDQPTGETPEDKVIVFTYKVIVNKTDGTNPLEGAGFTLYKMNADGEYVAIGEELVGDALTTFEWKGLDDGDYKLVETTTPAGYNSIADIEFTISAEHDLTWEAEEQTAILTKLDGGVLGTGDVSTGAITTEVVNQAGATLPETGGIGTTIFYVLGAVMVLGAAVLLVTKKRMSFAG